MPLDQDAPDEAQHGEQHGERALDALEERVDALYELRDRYFESRPTDAAPQRGLDVERALDELLREFDGALPAAGGAPRQRARYHFLRGRALNVTQEYRRDAEDCLSRAVKLQPTLVEAWNELGECYWKNDRLREARNCFESALKGRRNKVSLRNLSMVARQECVPPGEQRARLVEQGVALAKEAVQLDPQDGLSWAVLGNAHLSCFFLLGQDPRTLRQCMSAYAQAERDAVARATPDLHYNKAVALKYDERFGEALESFGAAASYDPTWQAPRTQRQQLLRYLASVAEMTRTAGRLHGKKRLHQMLQALRPHHLGPHAHLADTPLAQLRPGRNTRVVALGTVVCSVHNDDSVPFTFCLVDRASTCVCVTLYNLAQGKGVIIGDAVAIPEPFVTDVCFTHDGTEYKFRSLRVETPLMLAVNGRQLGRDQQASVQMSISKKAE